MKLHFFQVKNKKGKGLCKKSIRKNYESLLLEQLNVNFCLYTHEAQLHD